LGLNQHFQLLNFLIDLVQLALVAHHEVVCHMEAPHSIVLPPLLYRKVVLVLLLPGLLRPLGDAERLQDIDVPIICGHYQVLLIVSEFEVSDGILLKEDIILERVLIRSYRPIDDTYLPIGIAHCHNA